MATKEELKGRKFSVIEEEITARVMSLTVPEDFPTKNGVGTVSGRDASLELQDGSVIKFRLWGAKCGSVVEGDNISVEGAYCTEEIGGEPMLTSARKAGSGGNCKITVLQKE